MGNCFSDVKGGQQAIGGGPNPQGVDCGDVSGGCHDAVDYFFRARGEHSLSTPIQVHYKRESKQPSVG